MAYTAPTAATLRARFPRFGSVDEGIITSALAEAARTVDETWTEGDFEMGRMLYAAHILTLDGLGGGEADGFASGANGFKIMRSGSLSLERFDSGVGGGKSDSLLESTSYGRRFLDLLSRNFGGPVAVNG